jgi:hypothetical protein
MQKTVQYGVVVGMGKDVIRTARARLGCARVEDLHTFLGW